MSSDDPQGTPNQPTPPRAGNTPNVQPPKGAGQPLSQLPPPQFAARPPQGPQGVNQTAFTGAPGQVPPGAWANGPVPPGGVTGANAAGGKKKSPLKWIILAVALVLVAALSMIIPRLLAKTPEEKATETVQAYLTALSEGRGSDAKALLNETVMQGDSTWLTDDMVKASNAIAPLTVGTVGEATEDASASNFHDVPVTYNVGDQQIQRSYRVYAYQDQDPMIQDGTMPTSFYDMKPLISINGQTPTTQTLELFPGAYQLASTSQYVAFGKTTVVVGPDEVESPLSESELTASVNDAGLAMFREKVAAAAAACLASGALDPGCGLKLADHVTSGEQIRDGSVQRTQSPENAARIPALTATLSTTNPVFITTDDTLGSIDLSAELQENGQWVRYELTGFGSGFMFGTPTIDVTDPALTVQWS